MQVLCIEDNVQFRLLSVAGGAEAGTWLAEFCLPERIDPETYVRALRDVGRPFEVRVAADEGQLSPEDLEAEVLVVEGARVGDDLLSRLPRLRRVVVLGSDPSGIDSATCERRAVPVITVRRPTSDGVADHTMLLMLALARHLLTGARVTAGDERGRPQHPASVEAGGHPTTAFNWTGEQGVRALDGRRLGVLGAGEIGGQVLRRAAGFGMELGYVSRRRRPHLERTTGCRPLAHAELAEWSDVVSLHVGYSAALHHVADRSFLQALGPDGLLVNTSRGLLVDQAALTLALAAGEVGGAGLDVFETEPLDPGDPILTAPNVILTPHVGAGNRTVLVEEIGRLVAAIAPVEP